MGDADRGGEIVIEGVRTHDCGSLKMLMNRCNVLQEAHRVKYD